MSAPGEVYLADLGLQAKIRPVLILSVDDPNAARNLVTFVPITTVRKGGPYEVPFAKPPWLKEASVINVQGVTTMERKYLLRKIGRLDIHVMALVNKALKIWLPTLA